MFGPRARITYTRLPWWWALPIMWIVLVTLSPALAGEADEPFARADDPAPADAPLRIAGWQLVPMEHALRQMRQRDGATPRMLPLAVMPMPRSAWWLGLAASRGGGARVELRWTMPLDGSAPRTPVIER